MSHPLRRAAALASLLLAVSPCAARAEAAPGPDLPLRLAEEGRDLPPAEWRRLTAGRTVWYRIGDDLWGRERYSADGARLTFQFADGTCVEAQWTWIEPWFCFEFGPALDNAGPHCFRHIAHDGRLWALGLRGEPQAIDRIDDAPLSCGPAPVS